jgi:hypothetical protein
LPELLLKSRVFPQGYADKPSLRIGILKATTRKPLLFEIRRQELGIVLGEPFKETG